MTAAETPQAHAIDTMLLEERRYPPPPEFAANANARPEIYEEGFEAFWEREGRERVTWFEPFTSLLEWELPYAKWYGGGKLNVAYNCLDRHVEAGLGDRVAYFYEGEPFGEREEITYGELLGEVVLAGQQVVGSIGPAKNPSSDGVHDRPMNPALMHSGGVADDAKLGRGRFPAQ